MESLPAQCVTASVSLKKENRSGVIKWVGYVAGLGRCQEQRSASVTTRLSNLYQAESLTVAKI